MFAGALFRVDYAKALGGFPPESNFTGDWDMWFGLALRYGAAAVNRIVANSREHSTEGRGSLQVLRDGTFWALHFQQVRKNLALLRQKGIEVRFDRAAILKRDPVSCRFLLQNASRFRQSILAYNVGLLLRSPSPNPGHWLFRTLARWLGPRFVRAASRLYNALPRAAG
jgi:hypothetical protein